MRNELKQRGLIDFRERGTKATLYKVTIANSTQVSVQNSAQNGMQDGVQNSVRNGSTLKDIDIDIDRDRENPPISPIALFGE